MPPASARLSNEEEGLRPRRLAQLEATRRQPAASHRIADGSSQGRRAKKAFAPKRARAHSSICADVHLVCCALLCTPSFRSAPVPSLPLSWTGYLTMAESTSPTPAIPDKSRSLRKTSVKKRLETEVKRKEPKSMKDRLSKKARLSKYRRKSANAKERERMKRQNDVFEVLKEILPCDKAKRSDEEKETKVMLKT